MLYVLQWIKGQVAFFHAWVGQRFNLWCGIGDTRPWYTHGEGPTVEPEGHYKNSKEFLKIKYGWEDIRYTTSGETIYATLLGWPVGVKQVLLKSFAEDALPESLAIKSVSLLGSDKVLSWELADEGLSITIPATAPDEMAVVFKIEKK